MNRKMRLAAKECESMLRLCTSDNLGIRYTLIHIYAYLEEEKTAQKFFEKCGEEWGTRFPLAMALLTPYSYRPNTMEELFLIFTDYAYVYEEAYDFFFWAKTALRGMKRRKV